MSLTAVGRSIDVGLAADPASCLSTSTALAALAETCERAALVLGRHAQLDEAAFGGLSGIVYRTSSTLLEQACGRTGRRSRAKIMIENGKWVVSGVLRATSHGMARFAAITCGRTRFRSLLRCS